VSKDDSLNLQGSKKCSKSSNKEDSCHHLYQIDCQSHSSSVSIQKRPITFRHVTLEKTTLRKGRLEKLRADRLEGESEERRRTKQLLVRLRGYNTDALEDSTLRQINVDTMEMIMKNSPESTKANVNLVVLIKSTMLN